MEKWVKISQNNLFMLIVIGFLLYHHINMDKCKKNLQNISFLSSIQDLKNFTKTFFYPREKNQLTQCGPEWVHSIFLGQTACHGTRAL